jgi:hypothetical protein
VNAAALFFEGQEINIDPFVVDKDTLPLLAPVNGFTWAAWTTHVMTLNGFR